MTDTILLFVLVVIVVLHLGATYLVWLKLDEINEDFYE